MKKKAYEKPWMTVVELKNTDIIATSGSIYYSDGTYHISEGDDSAWGSTFGW